MGEARVRAKLGSGGCSLLWLVVGVVAVAGCEVGGEGEGGMTMWRVGASPCALQNSRTVTRSPVALIRPEVKMTPDWQSAKTGSGLSAMGVLASRKEYGCDVQVLGLGVVLAIGSPRVMRGRDVVRGVSDALCMMIWYVNIRLGN